MASFFRIEVTGLNSLLELIKSTQKNIRDLSLITENLAELMRKYVHRRTGYLASTIYYKNNIAGAKAPYAGYEELRGGSHAFGTKAIESVDISKYANRILK